MKQLQFYKYATLVLLLLNISMIGFFLLTKPKGPHRNGFGPKPTVEILKLDKQQHDAFLGHAKRHIEQMENYNILQKNQLKPYFNTLVDSTKNIDSNSHLQQVLQLERKKIESTYQHLQDVKSILRPEQQADFEPFVGSDLEIILLEKKNPLPSKEN